MPNQTIRIKVALAAKDLDADTLDRLMGRCRKTNINLIKIGEHND
jgi:hypothetical protein